MYIPSEFSWLCCMCLKYHQICTWQQYSCWTSLFIFSFVGVWRIQTTNIYTRCVNSEGSLIVQETSALPQYFQNNGCSYTQNVPLVLCLLALNLMSSLSTSPSTRRTWSACSLQVASLFHYRSLPLYRLHALGCSPEKTAPHLCLSSFSGFMSHDWNVTCRNRAPLHRKTISGQIKNMHRTGPALGTNVSSPRYLSEFKSPTSRSVEFLNKS